MKKRVISLLLVLALLVSAAPSALAAGGGFQFMQEVENALPEAAGVFLDGTPDLPKVGGTGFIRDPGGDLPEVREDGFLVKPTAPLKTFTGELLAEVSQPEEGAIEIATAEDLQKLAQGGSFVLTADIELSGTWTPIKMGRTAVKLDGQGHTISGLTLGGGGRLGLMDIVYGLEVRNLILRGVSIDVEDSNESTPYTYSGALAGAVYTHLTLVNCVLDGYSVYSSTGSYSAYYMGGFVGTAACDSGDVILRDCAASGIVDLRDAEGYANYTGGLVGDIDCADAELTDCLSDVDILLGESGSAYYMGGFSNSISASGSIDVLRCVSSGKVEGVLQVYSGIALMSANNTSFRDCLFNGSLKETDRDNGSSYSGGLAAAVGGTAKLINCRSEGSLSIDAGGLGGLVGDANARGGITFRHCLADSDISVEKTEFTGMGVGGLVGSLPHAFTLEDCLASGTVAMAEELELTARVGGLVGYVGVDGAVERCAHTGTVSGYRAGGLAGELKDNMSLTFTDCSHTGAVHGVYRTEDARPASDEYGTGGGALGVGHANFDNCVAGGTVTGDVAGGLLGQTTVNSYYNAQNSKVRFTDCRADLTLDGKTLGGLLGRGTESENLPTVSFEGCAAAVETDTTHETASQTVGGLMGQGFGTIQTCRTECTYAYASDSGSLTAGGLIGQNTAQAAIYNSSSTVTADTAGHLDKLGGLIGYGTGTETELNNCVAEVDFSSDTNLTAGGLAGQLSGFVLTTRCTATGTISNDVAPASSGNYNNFGGLFGAISSSSYATGDSSTLMLGQSCADVELDANLGSRYSSLYAGGLVGRASSATLYSSWAEGGIAHALAEADTRNGKGDIGGLIGNTGTLAMQDCCYLGDMPRLQTHNAAGGIAGAVTSGILRNCYAETDISGTGSEASMLGGIAGSLEAGTIRECFLDGSVSTGIGIAGGIAGKCGGTIQNCTTGGTVSGCTAGGIVGDMEGTIRDCTFSGTVRPEAGYDYVHTIGGIAGSMEGTLSGCTVEKAVRYSYHYEKSQYHYTGGIAGRFSGQMEDCVSHGASASLTDGWSAYAGGLAGSAGGTATLDNCRVEGSVMVVNNGLLWNNHVAYAGGLAGSAGTLYANACTVNGNVTGSISLPPDTDTFSYAGSLTVGGLAGYASHLWPEACQFNGVLIYPAETDQLTVYHKFPPQLGDGKLEGYSAPEVVVPEKPEEDYTVTVFGYTRENFNGYLLEGATVKVDGKTVGTSNGFGEVTFSSKDMEKTGYSLLEVSHPDYFENSQWIYLVHDGKDHIMLRKKVPGEIYFKTVQYQNEFPANLLNRLDEVRVLQQDTDYKNVEVRVDWYDSDEEGREVYLINGDNNTKFILEDGGVNRIPFSTVFEPDEDIYIAAKATWNGEPVEARELLSIKVQPLPIRLNVDKGKAQVGADSEDEEDSKLYFLPGLNLELGFGSMVPFASDISILNGNLKIKFTWKQGQQQAIDVWKLGSTLFDTDVFIEGELTVPINENLDGEWRGDLTFGINQMPGVDFDEQLTIKSALVDLEYPGVVKVEFPLPLPVPSYLETQIGVGGSGTLEFYGPYNGVNVAGRTNVTGYGLVGVGVGGSIGDEFEAKVGGEGELRPDISMRHDPAAGNPLSFDPQIDGALSLKATLKAFDLLGGEVKLKAGSFSWTKDSLEWTLLGQSGSKLMELEGLELMEAGEWTPVSRSYLEHGGGFRRGGASLLGLGSAGVPQVRYENIAPTTDTAMAVNSSGEQVLYFTADSGFGTGGAVGGHTALFMSVRSGDDWGAPKTISTDGTYPALPHASGDYAVWVESTDTETLDGMLSSTVIRLAKNGEVVASYDPGCYAYDPRVAASKDGAAAIVTWLQNASVTADNLLGGAPKLYFATFKNGTLSKPVVRNDAVAGLPTYDSTPVFGLYTRSENHTLSKGYNTIATSAYRYDTDGTVTAVFDEDGTLTLYNNSTAVKSLSTGFNLNGSPALVKDPNSDTRYLFWAETGGIRCMKATSTTDWGEPLLLTATSGQAQQLSAVMGPEGIPCVSYLLTQTDGTPVTNLYTMDVDPDTMDLVLTRTSYDEDELLNTGKITLECVVFNNGFAAAEGTQVTITDENGAQVYQNTFTRPTASGGTSRFYAQFAPDGAAAHTYTVTAEAVVKGVPVPDCDESDNTLQVGIKPGEGKLVQMTFQRGTDPKQPELRVLSRNVGGASVEAMTVTITDGSGAAVAQETFTDIPGGSTRQLLLKEVSANERYTVTVESDGVETDRQTALYSDPDAPRLTFSLPEVEGSGAKVRLTAQGQEETACNILLALYQGGRMHCITAESLSTLNGSKTLNFDFGEAPRAGTYDYKLFLLTHDGAWQPLKETRTGTLTVE